MKKGKKYNKGLSRGIMGNKGESGDVKRIEATGIRSCVDARISGFEVEWLRG